GSTRWQIGKALENRKDCGRIETLGRGPNPELCKVVRRRRTNGMMNRRGQPSTTTGSTRLSERAAAPAVAQKVVIVNGSNQMLEMLETVLDAGHYDVVFVES